MVKINKLGEREHWVIKKDFYNEHKEIFISFEEILIEYRKKINEIIDYINKEDK